MEQSIMMSDQAQDETGIGEEETPTPKDDPNAPKKGFLLDEKDELKVCKRILKDRERQEPAMSRLRALWTRTKLWREGQRHVKLDTSEDKWEARVPSGMGDAPPLPNKTDRICRRVANVVWADDPLPETEPASDTAEDKEAAETSSRLLKIETAVGRLNFPEMMRRLVDKGNTFASSFVYFYIDPTAGGKMPKRVIAHKNAVQFIDEDQVLVDPETQQKAGDQEQVEKFVAVDGTLTDDELKAEQVWIPAIKRKLLTGNNVLFLPASADGIEDARGVHLTLAVTLGDLKAMFPKKFEGMDDAALKKLVDWRCPGFDEAVPEYLNLSKRETEDGKPTDDSIVCVQCEYWTECAEYPKGAYVCMAGENTLLHREEWSRVIQLANGKKKDETLFLPVAQNRSLNDNNTDNPYGIALGDKIGPADEVRAAVIEFQLDHLWKSANPHYFIPEGSTVQPGQLLNRNGDPIYTNPNGTPAWEQIADFPAIGREMMDAMTSEINDESSLQETAQGTEVSSVTSGVQARAVIEEAQKGLTEIRTNSLQCYVRSCQIVLQMMRAFYSQERIAKYQGEDGKYKTKAWSSSDLGSTKDVRIARGSATMMSPSMKRELAMEELNAGSIDAAEYAEISASSLNPVLGVQDNPFMQKIRSEISTWRDGAPTGFNELVAAHAAFMGKQAKTAQVAAAVGADPAIAGQMQAPAPLPSPFRRIPVDLEPQVAQIRHRELARTMTSEAFQTPKSQDTSAGLTPEAVFAWQGILISEYQQMYQIVSMAQMPAVEEEAPAPKSEGKPGAKKAPAKPARAQRKSAAR